VSEGLKNGFSSHFTAKIGLAAELFDSDVDRVVLTSSFSDTLLYDGVRFWQFELTMEGFWNKQQGG
jgi:hypothetical protein